MFIHNTLYESYGTPKIEIETNKSPTSKSNINNYGSTTTFASTINGRNLENNVLNTNTIIEEKAPDISINTPEVETDNNTIIEEKAPDISINTPEVETDNNTIIEEKAPDISINTPEVETDNNTIIEEKAPDISINTPEVETDNNTIIEEKAPDISINTPENDNLSEESPFYSFTKKELQDECETRGLSTSGNKVSLIDRLVTDEITKNNK